jgi:hypothetical protein
MASCPFFQIAHLLGEPFHRRPFRYRGEHVTPRVHRGGIMPTTAGMIRRRLMAPSLHDVSFAGRGFPVTPTDATRRLEAVPQSVICGFEWGIETRGLWETERRLDMVEPELRGFAYEGATMAATIRDAMGGGLARRTTELLAGPGERHIFLAYIGIGFAMARLPRVLWKKVLPDLPESRFHPVMSWLAVDGYAFDRAYFDTRRWVDEQYVPSPYPWQGRPDYFPRAADQGIGRALWFIHGGRPTAVAAAVARFDPSRHADLYSGVGLAATFAGGCDRDDHTVLRELAGAHSADLALGAVFAIKARDHADFVPAHTHVAADVLLGRSIEDTVTLADTTGDDLDPDGEQPPYEQWRARIRAHFDRTSTVRNREVDLNSARPGH